VPETWLNVMRDCDGTESDRQHMTLDEFRETCQQRGEPEPGKQESLARLLHKLGVVLHFVDEPRLRDTTVLDPHWVTDGVYRLLRFKDSPDSDGVLSLTEALQALPGEDERDARFLLRLMERFEMCFPLEGEANAKQPTKWLIPGALAEFQPAGVTDVWQQPGGVRLRYVYDPLPEGVLPRFIVRTHLLSEQHPRWRNGVVLTDGRAKALVRRGANRNHVEVTAFGPDADRLRLLQIIQGNLERIHADLPDPKPYAELELDALPGVYRPLADLAAAELGKQQVAVRQGRESLLVEPTPQLNRTSEPTARSDERLPLETFLSYSHKDKRAKQIFQDNLTVMQQKKLITTWHDGLIEPGMLWKKEIEENLARMDVFVGLLTTAFLASDFIREVELEVAKERLNNDERNFLFVLILVDDISLDIPGLDAYQILKPGGKAVSKHPNRKVGFDQAQKELEKLLRKRQPKNQTRQNKDRGFEPQGGKGQSENAGITVIVQGDYIEGEKHMRDDNSLNIGGNVINSQVAQSMNHCAITIGQQAPGDQKNLLRELHDQVTQLLSALPEEHSDKADGVAKKMKTLVEEATSSSPDREWYNLSAKGVLEAAGYVQELTGKIGGTILNLGKSLWPDFLLPGSKK
jgi:hypothetical protein